MIFSHLHIYTKAKLVVDVVNSVLAEDKQEVYKIFLIGSYASGNPTEYSDIDYLIQLRQDPNWLTPSKWYPSWKKIEEVHKRLDTTRIHVIFGTEEAARSLHQKNKHRTKDYTYAEINLNLSPKENYANQYRTAR